MTPRKNPMDDEHYDGNDEQIADLKDLVDTLTDALDATVTQMEQCAKMFRDDVEYMDALRLARKALKAKRGEPVKQVIVVDVEGGLVQNVSGVPFGVKVEIVDHDEGDTSHPSYDEEREAFVSVYEA